jgi:hypothetical protein
MNEEQARTMIGALDLAIRIKLGQWGQLVEHCMEWDYDKIDECCKRRDEAERVLLAARNIVMPELLDMNSLAGSHGVYSGEEHERLYNVLLAVRSAIAWHNHPEGGYTVDFREPMDIHVHEEMPKCEVVEDAGAGSL